MNQDEARVIKVLEEELTRARKIIEVKNQEIEYQQAQLAEKKTRVPGGFYLMNRGAEKHLRALARENPAAGLVLSVIREHMGIGSNAVTVSQGALAKMLGLSRPTISRAVKHLRDHNYVQVIKSGNTNTYVVNERICFAGSPGQRRAVFSSTVIAHECEQTEDVDAVKKLKPVPILQHGERVILGDEDLPPPDQRDLDLD